MYHIFEHLFALARYYVGKIYVQWKERLHFLITGIFTLLSMQLHMRTDVPYQRLSASNLSEFLKCHNDNDFKIARLRGTAWLTHNTRGGY